MWISEQLDFEEGDRLVWRYYDKAKVSVVYKREGWKSREARLSRENAGNEKANSTVNTHATAAYT
jgi:hypothetical protein